MLKKLSSVVMLPVMFGSGLLSHSLWADTAKEKSYFYPDKIQQLSSPVDEVLKSNPEIQISSLGVSQTIDWSGKKGARSQAELSLARLVAGIKSLAFLSRH